MAHDKFPPGGLVLTRVVGQGFLIVVNGEPVLLEVRERSGGQIRIAIHADKSKVAVIRHELTREECASS